MKTAIDWVNTGLKKRKVKVFLFFLLCATFAWFINNLSQTYTSNSYFEIEYVNIPKDVLLANTPKDKIQVRLKTVGFQFLGYGINPKKISLDVSKGVEIDSLYQLTTEEIKTQLEAQLRSNSTLVNFEKSPIYFEFTSLKSIMIKVQPRLTLDYANNYILEGQILVSPDSIKITGPKSQIDTISVVYTESSSLSDLSDDFSINLALVLPELGEEIKVSNENVTISGSIVKFSEKVIEVPLNVINLPEGVKVRTFPELVNVRCQGTLKTLKALSADDFRVEADYKSVSGETGNRLPLSVVGYPKNLNNVSIDINEIEFILRRE